MKKKLKICLISSSGGHLAQIRQLEPILKNYDYFLITEKNQATLNLTNNSYVYYLNQQERKSFRFLFVLYKNIIKSIYLFFKEKPDVVISTGAGAVIPYCFIAKLFNKKIIFIESFAKIKSPTITGRVLYYISDKFYVQWEDMLKFYPNAEYRGKIY